jgi:membrane protein
MTRSSHSSPVDRWSHSGETHPRQLSMREWWRVLKRVKAEVTTDNLALVAAGVAFYGFFALFPAIVALISLYGALTDPSDIQRHLELLLSTLPESARDLIAQELGRVSMAASDQLSWGALIGFVVVLWSANRGMKGIVAALNVAYDRNEERGFVRLYALTLSLTLSAIASVVLIMGLIAVVPILLRTITLGYATSFLIQSIRWLVLTFLVMTGLAVLYHYGPDRRGPPWRWVTPGAVVATVCFLAASAGFSYYVSNFASYNQTYGSVAGVAILMLWLYIAAFVVLLGAEINSSAEAEANERAKANSAAREAAQLRRPATPFDHATRSATNPGST